MDITLTRHAAQRVAQRLSKQTDFDLILRYAAQGDHDMVVTNDSVFEAELDAIAARRNADRLRRMKGLHIPLGSDGSVITLERLNRGKAKRLLSGRRFQRER
jgi:hypothetical protein